MKTRKDDFYSLAEAAERLQVSRTTIWRWVSQGRLPAYRVGPRRLRVRRDDVDGMEHVRPIADRAPAAQELDALFRNYDPVKARQGLESLKGLFKDIDTGRLKRDIRKARSQRERLTQ